jgi:hypothetical protein
MNAESQRCKDAEKSKPRRHREHGEAPWITDKNDLPASLQGIWKQALRPEDQGDWISETVAQVRHESAERLDRLARELGESPSREG